MTESTPLPGPPGAEPALAPDVLISGVMAFLADKDVETLREMRGALAREIDSAGPGALHDLSVRLANAGADWTFYPRDPLARRIHQVLADKLLHEDSTVLGIEHVAEVPNRGPVVIVANHLSYADANLLELLLQRGGAAALADRLTVMAGPKVYSSRTRRFSSLCFDTIKTPQNSARSTEDAVMSAREVAHAARQSIDMAHERLRRGDAVLVFPEGMRSRSRGMQQMLGGVARYFEVPGTQVLPVGITGTEAMFPVGDNRLHRVPIVAQVGHSIDAGSLRERTAHNRRLMMDTLGLAIADLLPEVYRGIYGHRGAELDAARRVLQSV
jgi:1-acyl-sn-glycerol-3-phosphate acyltransferase